MPSQAPSRKPGRWLTLSAIVLLALNLRPVAAAPGPVLSGLAADLGMNGAVAGLLTSLPLICFAVFGAAAPWLAGRIGTHRAVIGALALVVAGQLLRNLVTSAPVFLGCSVIALAGMAVGNVLLPSLVRLHFPDRLGVVTAVYSMCLATGLTAASMLTAPLAEATGGWRAAFAVWMWLAVAGLVCWLFLIRADPPNPAGARPRIGVRRIARTRLGWLLALFFGFQSSVAYSIFGWLASIYAAAGFSATRSGLYLGVATGVGIPLAFLLPSWVARRSAVAPLLLTGFTGVLAFGGLLIAPRAAPLLWAVLAAFGNAAFPIFLALLAQRARTAEGTAALSAFSQSVGYLLAIPGPLLIGILYQLGGDFTWPLLLLTTTMLPLCGLGILAARSRCIEDELDQAPRTRW